MARSSPISDREGDPVRHSVIVGSYNRPSLCVEAIRSVLSQDPGDFELVVSDDGSDEATVGSILSAIEGDARCRFMTVARVSPSEAGSGFVRAVQRINDALPLLRGDAVHYLADDDLFAPGRFRVFDEMFADPSVMVAYGRLAYIQRDGSPAGKTRYFPTVLDPMNVLDQNQVAHRRTALERVPRWPSIPPGEKASDGVFLRELSKYHAFHGRDALVGMKRLHDMNMQEVGGDRRVRE
jgi:glycosyltransferase involved in cell wall biosynthesis